MNFQPILEKEMHCSCGRVHSTDLKAVDIGRGALERLPELLRGLGFHKAYIAADVNTWEAAGKKAAAIRSLYLTKQLSAPSCCICPRTRTWSLRSAQVLSMISANISAG